MSNEKLLLKCSDFQNRSELWIQGAQRDTEFCDVTLVCKDYEVQAHRLVLSWGSRVFQQILQKAKHAHPIIYLQGISQHELKYVLEFLYTGEVRVAKSRLEMFFESAMELKIIGILDQVETETSFEPLSEGKGMVTKNEIELKAMALVDSFHDVKPFFDTANNDRLAKPTISGFQSPFPVYGSTNPNPLKPPEPQVSLEQFVPLAGEPSPSLLQTGVSKIAQSLLKEEAESLTNERPDVGREDPLDPGVMPSYAKREEDDFGVVKYRCMTGKKCVKTFNKLETLKNHVDSNHIVRSFPCNQCKHSSFTRNQMMSHKKIAHREPDQKCHICHEAFKTTTILASHFLKTHEEQQCKKCCFKATGKKFYNHTKNCYKLKNAHKRLMKKDNQT